MDINPEQLFSKTDKLLYLILQELRQMNAPVRPTAEGTKAATQKPKVTCKRCGKSFEGHGVFLKHSKACKKESETNARKISR
jgi:hypothetical protein